MNQNLRLGTASRSVLTMALLTSLSVACTTQEAKNPDGGVGGSTGSGSGGKTGGGTGGSGMTAACGTGPFAPTPGMLCLPPTQMITDFTYDPDAGTTDQVRFGTFGTTLSGGESSYSNAPGTVTANVTENDWHIMGNVANYSGFGLYFDTVNGCNMADASAFDGITFTIWGTTANMPITMGIGVLSDAVTPSWLTSVDAGSAMPTPGSCIPTMGNGPFYHPGCADPVTTINVTGTQASPQMVSLHWTDFMNGQCKANVVPNEILSVYWQFLWSPTPPPPYAVDIHIDNLAFIPKP
jgi:hypothetical protein